MSLPIPLEWLTYFHARWTEHLGPDVAQLCEKKHQRLKPDIYIFREKVPEATSALALHCWHEAHANELNVQNVEMFYCPATSGRHPPPLHTHTHTHCCEVIVMHWYFRLWVLLAQKWTDTCVQETKTFFWKPKKGLMTLSVQFRPH